MALSVISGDIIYDGASSLPDSQGESQMRIQVAGFDSSVEKRFRFAAKKLSEKWFFDSLFYAPVQVGDQTLLLNLRSTAKRLGISYWTVRKACKEGTLDQLIAAKAAKTSLEKLTALKQHLPVEEAIAIQTFVHRELPKWRAQKRPRFIHASEATAPRTIQYDPVHDIVYVHLNRKPDKRLGVGSQRTFKFTMNYNTAQILARGVVILKESERERQKPGNYQRIVARLSEVTKEVRALELLRDVPGVIKTYRVDSYVGAGNVQKVAFIQELGKGTLNSYLKRGVLTEKQKKSIAKQLLITLREIHRKDVAHNDLHTNNILIFDHLRVKITDFGLSTALNDESHGRDITQLIFVFREIFPDRKEELGVLVEQVRDQQITLDDALQRLEQYT